MNKKNPFKISICNELFQGWPIEKVFEYVAKLGYDGVEISPFTLADSVTEISTKRRNAIRRAAEDNGIEIVGLHWLLVKPEGLYINHPDEYIRIQTQEYIEPSSTSALTSEEKSLSTVLPTRGRSKKGGTPRIPGIMPSRRSRSP
jgi:hypothetical protein